MLFRSDGLKLLLGLFALGGLAASSEISRFERDAARDVAAKLQGAHKRVRLTTVSQGPLGLLKGDVRRGTIFASDFQTERLPLHAEPERPQTGKLRELRLDLRHFQLSSLQIERLSASIPDCRFDLALAKREHRIRLSKSGEGIGEVEVKESALAEFILAKYREIKEVSVRLKEGKAYVEGDGVFLILKTHFQVVARLESVDGRRIALTDAKVRLEGQEASAEAAAALLRSLNPVVDLDKDLKLDGAIDVQTIALDAGRLTVRGRTRIPILPNASLK